MKHRAETKLLVAIEGLDARPDTIDFRDRLFIPTLVEVPREMGLDQHLRRYRKGKVRILDQGGAGKCAGYGLAAVANALLAGRKVAPDTRPVSARMLYEMARRYDEWPGEDYCGTSARGAMKGWHKHGVCAEALWPDEDGAEVLTHARALDAARRPLGAYFRVNHLDLVAMHCAMAEAGVIYATASVHGGWGEVTPAGVIPRSTERLGGHAFAIVGYDTRGFWIQNSWGCGWGLGGLALITYDDWFENGMDAWVARLGAPVDVVTPGRRRISPITSSGSVGYAYHGLRPHLVRIGNDGQLRTSGTFGTSAAEVREIFRVDMPRLAAGWSKKRLLIYGHGGLVGEERAVERIGQYRKRWLAAEIYPLALIWRTDLWSTVGKILDDTLGRRGSEAGCDLPEFMLDRLDDSLEVLARPAGRALWAELRENALLATVTETGGARLVLEELGRLLELEPDWEVHAVGHSAGSILLGPFVQVLCSRGLVGSGPAKGVAGLGRRLESMTLWAPACTVGFFRETFWPGLREGSIRRFNLYTLKEMWERADDCVGVYHKSLLYLVSNALEGRERRLGGMGEALVGMEKFIVRDPMFGVGREDLASDPAVVSLFGQATANWVRSPNNLETGRASAAQARRHGDFDDDEAVVMGTVAGVLGSSPI